MKINGIEITAKKFAFDGCHKIYLIESPEEELDARQTGYDIFPINFLQQAYKDSCQLKFIQDWALTIDYVPQFEKAVFK